eukprot:GHVS01016787.1.p1 GENE.GHVS01016787.1~~GHVS01016787.1.p1  ORF type:complete len:138 (+),score=18.55 GHVS01016787.1:279-692(+)
MAGSDGLRFTWEKFYKNIFFSGVVFMINLEIETSETIAECRREVEELLNRAELGSANLAVLLNSRSDRRRPLSQRECMCLLGLTELPPPLRDRVKTFEVDAQETHRDNSWQLALGWLVANIAMGSSSRPSHLATTTN